MYTHIRQLLEAAIDGERAKGYVHQIWEFDRHNSFAYFAKSAAYVVETLRRSGLEAAVEEFPADGKTRFGDFLAPKAWDVDEATLDILEPEKRRIADWSAEPLTLFMGSSSTPEGGLTTELVRAPKTGNLEGHDFSGRIVFAPAHKDAVLARGALGVVTYHANEKLPDIDKITTRWTG